MNTLDYLHQQFPSTIGNIELNRRLGLKPHEVEFLASFFTDLRKMIKCQPYNTPLLDMFPTQRLDESERILNDIMNKCLNL